jgi:transcriptional regulator with XRE-family HTH domain
VVKCSNHIDKSIGCSLPSVGWSQEQLAEKLQIDSEDVSAYEKGEKRITAERIIRLSKVFWRTTNYFFSLDGGERPLPPDRSYLTLSYRGFRLHRAFVRVKNPPFVRPSSPL